MTPEIVAQRLNLHRAGRDFRGDCPDCGYREAFKVSTGRNGQPLLWCSSCNLPDGPAGIFAQIGGAPPAQAQQEPRHDADRAAHDAARVERARRAWCGAVAPNPDDPVGRYLAMRGIAAIMGSTSIRYRPDTWHPSKRQLDAMLALIVGTDGTPQAIHRTFLTPDGRKGNVEPVKASLGIVAGGAVRLAPASPDLLIAEGIETAASAGILTGLPAWSSVSAGNLEHSLDLPDLVRRVTIAADPDGPGLRAAEAAARRWKRQGREVRIIKPQTAGTDFNDVLMARSERGEAA
ncbi:toprim domain-containing protein [Acidiphilium sp. PA]|uniref:DUF7146 domain-containing protein n=1 Tax=Acidiphilium sp. PA TaxID=2871705 RepID=UPI0022437F80|nr:toprim domain-containing protein [Acidiphilium sp. PA]MCW8308396.1 toprim domain-containing protein [Acidiphilium sp. PA]